MWRVRDIFLWLTLLWRLSTLVIGWNIEICIVFFKNFQTGIKFVPRWPWNWGWLWYHLKVPATFMLPQLRWRDQLKLIKADGIVHTIIGVSSHIPSLHIIMKDSNLNSKVMTRLGTYFYILQTIRTTRIQPVFNHNLQYLLLIQLKITFLNIIK